MISIPNAASGPQTGTVLLALENVSTQLGSKEGLSNLYWTFRSGESWALVGPNGAGKTTLVQVLLQRRPYFQGTIRRHPELLKPERIGYVALHQQKQLIAREERKERWEDYSGKEQVGLTCRSWVTAEVHPDPENSAVDPLQAIDFDAFEALMGDMEGVAAAVGRTLGR